MNLKIQLIANRYVEFYRTLDRSDIQALIYKVMCPANCTERYIASIDLFRANNLNELADKIDPLLPNTVSFNSNVTYAKRLIDVIDQLDRGSLLKLLVLGSDPGKLKRHIYQMDPSLHKDVMRILNDK